MASERGENFKLRRRLEAKQAEVDEWKTIVFLIRRKLAHLAEHNGPGCAYARSEIEKIVEGLV